MKKLIISATAKEVKDIICRISEQYPGITISEYLNIMGVEELRLA